MSLIITIGGAPGSGKSSVGKMLAARLNIPFFSMGDVRRHYAAERGLTINELNKLAESDPTSDRLVDEYQVQLPRHHHSFVIDSRLGFHFLPKSVKIYVQVDRKTAAERIFAAKRHEEQWKNVDEGITAIEEREESDRRRYIHLYNVDHTTLIQYDLVLDSTHMDQMRMVDEILAYLEKHALLPKKSL